MSLCIGLTGGIGCGKSTVAKMFQARGACVIDTDEIAHQLTGANGRAIDAIRAAFGDRYIAEDGSMNRSGMRELVFSDELAKQRLERLLHPLILDSTQAQLRQAYPAPYVVLVVPLLFGSPDFLRLVQRVLVVDCAESRQIERVMRRSQLGEPEVRAIMAQQTGRAARLRGADDVLHNDGDLASLAGQVAALHDIYSAMSAQNGD